MILGWWFMETDKIINSFAILCNSYTAADTKKAADTKMARELFVEAFTDEESNTLDIDKMWDIFIGSVNEWRIKNPNEQFKGEIGIQFALQSIEYAQAKDMEELLDEGPNVPQLASVRQTEQRNDPKSDSTTNNKGGARPLPASESASSSAGRPAPRRASTPEELLRESFNCLKDRYNVDTDTNRRGALRDLAKLYFEKALKEHLNELDADTRRAAFAKFAIIVEPRIGKTPKPSDQDLNEIAMQSINLAKREQDFANLETDEDEDEIIMVDSPSQDRDGSATPPPASASSSSTASQTENSNVTSTRKAADPTAIRNDPDTTEKPQVKHEIYSTSKNSKADAALTEIERLKIEYADLQVRRKKAVEAFGDNSAKAMLALAERNLMAGSVATLEAVRGSFLHGAPFESKDYDVKKQVLLAAYKNRLNILQDTDDEYQTLVDKRKKLEHPESEDQKNIDTLIKNEIKAQHKIISDREKTVKEFWGNQIPVVEDIFPSELMKELEELEKLDKQIEEIVDKIQKLESDEFLRDNKQESKTKEMKKADTLTAKLFRRTNKRNPTLTYYPNSDYVNYSDTSDVAHIADFFSNLAKSSAFEGKEVGSSILGRGVGPIKRKPFFRIENGICVPNKNCPNELAIAIRNKNSEEKGKGIYRVFNKDISDDQLKVLKTAAKSAGVEIQRTADGIIVKDGEKKAIDFIKINAHFKGKEIQNISQGENVDRSRQQVSGNEIIPTKKDKPNINKKAPSAEDKKTNNETASQLKSHQTWSVIIAQQQAAREQIITKMKTQCANINEAIGALETLAATHEQDVRELEKLKQAKSNLSRAMLSVNVGRQQDRVERQRKHILASMSARGDKNTAEIETMAGDLLEALNDIDYAEKNNEDKSDYISTRDGLTFNLNAAQKAEDKALDKKIAELEQKVEAKKEAKKSKKRLENERANLEQSLAAANERLATYGKILTTATTNEQRLSGQESAYREALRATNSEGRSIYTDNDIHKIIVYPDPTTSTLTIRNLPANKKDIARFIFELSKNESCRNTTIQTSLIQVEAFREQHRMGITPYATIDDNGNVSPTTNCPREIKDELNRLQKERKEQEERAAQEKAAQIARTPTSTTAATAASSTRTAAAATPSTRTAEPARAAQTQSSATTNATVTSSPNITPTIAPAPTTSPAPATRPTRTAQHQVYLDSILTSTNQVISSRSSKKEIKVELNGENNEPNVANITLTGGTQKEREEVLRELSIKHKGATVELLNNDGSVSKAFRNGKEVKDFLIHVGENITQEKINEYSNLEGCKLVSFTKGNETFYALQFSGTNDELDAFLPSHNLAKNEVSEATIKNNKLISIKNIRGVNGTQVAEPIEIKFIDQADLIAPPKEVVGTPAASTKQTTPTIQRSDQAVDRQGAHTPPPPQPTTPQQTVHSTPVVKTSRPETSATADSTTLTAPIKPTPAAEQPASIAANRKPFSSAQQPAKNQSFYFKSPNSFSYPNSGTIYAYGGNTYQFNGTEDQFLDFYKRNKGKLSEIVQVGADDNTLPITVTEQGIEPRQSSTSDENADVLHSTASTESIYTDTSMGNVQLTQSTAPASAAQATSTNNVSSTANATATTASNTTKKTFFMPFWQNLTDAEIDDLAKTQGCRVVSYTDDENEIEQHERYALLFSGTENDFDIFWKLHPKYKTGTVYESTVENNMITSTKKIIEYGQKTPDQPTHRKKINIVHHGFDPLVQAPVQQAPFTTVPSSSPPINPPAASTASTQHTPNTSNNKPSITPTTSKDKQPSNNKTYQMNLTQEEYDQGIIIATGRNGKKKRCQIKDILHDIKYDILMVKSNEDEKTSYRVEFTCTPDKLININYFVQPPDETTKKYFYEVQVTENDKIRTTKQLSDINDRSKSIEDRTSHTESVKPETFNVLTRNVVETTYTTNQASSSNANNSTHQSQASKDSSSDTSWYPPGYL